MGNDIVITTPTRKHLGQVESWASHNAAATTLLKLPGETDTTTPNAQSWVAVRGDEVLAIATVRLNKEHVGYLNCIVKPGRQRQGVGSQIIAHVLQQPFVKDLIHLHAAVDPANAAAQKILNSNDFSRVGYSPDGRVEFARHKD